MDWRRTVAGLRGQFEAASLKHPHIYHAVTESRGKAGDSMIEEVRSRWFKNGPPCPPKPTELQRLGLGCLRQRRAVTRPAGDESACGVALGVIFGPETDGEGAGRLIQLAEAAGAALLSVAGLREHPALRDLRPDDFSGREADYWLLAVHRLGWHNAQPAIKSMRWMWYYTGGRYACGTPRRLELEYRTLEELRELAKTGAAYASALQRPGDTFYAVLDLNMFTASVLAIEALLVIRSPEGSVRATSSERNTAINESLKRDRERAEELRARAEMHARAVQADQPLAPSEAAEQLRAIGHLHPTEHLPWVFETAGAIVLKMVRRGLFKGAPRARDYVLVHTANLKGADLTGLWSDFVITIREERGLPRVVPLGTLSEDAELIADIIEQDVFRETAPAKTEKRRITVPSPKPGVDGAKQVELAHAPDFTWVIWFGQKYNFSKGNQAESVRHLWDAWDRSGRRDGCGLADATIAEVIGVAEGNFRLKSVFRDDPAMGTMIREVGKGMHALFREPPTSEEAGRKRPKKKKN